MRHPIGEAYVATVSMDRSALELTRTRDGSVVGASEVTPATAHDLRALAAAIDRACCRHPEFDL